MNRYDCGSKEGGEVQSLLGGLWQGREISVCWRGSCVLSHSVVSNFATPWTAACQAPLSMGILQARILEWVAMPSSRGSSRPRDRTGIEPASLTSPALAGGF